MRYGVTTPTTDQTWRIDELAFEAEARGFVSLHVPEHTHIPVGRKTAPPVGEPELAEYHKRLLDPFVALATAAVRTSRIRLGTGICVVAQHDPIVLAKTIATLDHLSGGRVDLGIGFGWNVDEMEQHGVDPARRRDIVREHVLAMRALWTDEVAAFRGEFVQLEPAWSWPKPVQVGGPPVRLGSAAGPKAFAAIAEYCDGWLPLGAGGVRRALPALHEACERIGRDPATVSITPFGARFDPEKVEYYESLGITDVILRIPDGTRDQVLPELDRLATVTGTVGASN